MTVREAAKLLEVSERKVYDLIAVRKIAHYRVGAGQRAAIRFDAADVLAYKASCRVEVDAAAAPPAPLPARRALPSVREVAARRRAGVV